MLYVESIRHPKERGYFIFMVVVSVILYLVMLVGIMFTLPALLVLGLWYWWRSEVFKARMYGNSVLVSASQYGEIYSMVAEQSRQLGLLSVPRIFILKSNGSINASALKLFGKRFVILYADLVDVLLAKGEMDHLAMITGHELGHHAAGHLSFGKGLLIGPAKIVPFVGAAYSRACELTADRIGYSLIKDEKKAKEALITAVALGSWTLSAKTDINTFAMQEAEVPAIAGFFSKLSDSHPRTTIRILELGEFVRFGANAYSNAPQQHYNQYTASGFSSGAATASAVAADSSSFCPSCGGKNTRGDSFCGHCGSRLM